MAQIQTLSATPTRSGIPQKLCGFDSLVDALTYAARGSTGCNFYNGRGQLTCALTYAELLQQSQDLACHLAALGLPRGARIGILADTDPLFHRFFFACQFAGMVPVALPAGFQLGGGEAYVAQLRRLLQGCGANAAVAPESHVNFLRRAAEDLPLTLVGTAAEFEAVPAASVLPAPLSGDETAYLQYTSGSTQFPRGAQMTQRSILNNLSEIAAIGGNVCEDDRLVSWLPFYHDMGLVGFVLEPVIAQLSVDYLSPQAFAMRPRLWLELLSNNRGTISSSPPFGYSLCAARVKDKDARSYDLSAWRMACVGAERIHPEPLTSFAEALAPAGFSEQAFVACYGMAECGLAVSFAPLNVGLELDRVDKLAMTDTGAATTIAAAAPVDAGLTFVDCGVPLPSYEVAIRDDAGQDLPDRQCGRICVRGPNVMSGYFEDPAATAAVLAEDGWLDTGDIGYRMGDRLVVTARRKDVIIVNGRNLWPQDLEFLAEQVMDLRLGNVSAFSVSRPDGEDLAVMVVESKRGGDGLSSNLKGLIRESFGIVCHVEIVPPRTLPRTSSGKLSRSKAKADFLARTHWNQEGWPQPVANEEAARPNLRAS
ncbi:MAG: fatty acyl-AMP ligase [Pseudomonadales bacterium]